MISTRHFRIQLLCVVSILTTLTLDASPLRMALRRLYATEVAAATSQAPTNAASAALDQATITGLSTVYTRVHSIERKLDVLSRKGKLITFLTLTTLGQAAYIAHEKDACGVATYLEELMKKWAPDSKAPSASTPISTPTQGSQPAVSDEVSIPVTATTR